MLCQRLQHRLINILYGAVRLMVQGTLLRMMVLRNLWVPQNISKSYIPNPLLSVMRPGKQGKLNPRVTVAMRVSPPTHPEGPCTQLVYTLASKYLYRDDFKAKVYTIWVHGLSWKINPRLNPVAPSQNPYAYCNPSCQVP